jgi:hypothetical protein
MEIYTVGDGKTFLEPQFFTKLPSIAALEESPRTSDKYNFFSTRNVVEMLLKQQWYPVKAQEQRVRNEGRKGFQKHMIRFRRQDEILTNVGDLAMEIILTNSHDGLSAYHLMLGMFRLACLNGMIVSEANFGTIKFRHLGFKESDVIDASYKVIEGSPRLMNKVQEYRQIELKPDDKFQFAESALELKFGDGETEAKTEGANTIIGDRTFNLPALLAPKRKEDMSNNLWTVFNVLQEKLVKGNNYERTVRNVDGRTIHRTKVSEIKGIDETIRVNKGLWELLDIFREVASA